MLRAMENRAAAGERRRRVTYRTTPLCDEDIINIYVSGVTDFGIDQAEAYHAGLVRTFALIASDPRLARRRIEFDPPVRMHHTGRM